MNKLWFLAVAMAVFPHNALGAEEPPKTMIHLIAQMSGTNILPGSFAEKPKVMWRASNSYCRIDEEPDPNQGLHLRTIMNEPDSWLVDLASKRAKHMVDHGPTFNCRMPIFALSMEMYKSKIGELEYGHELEFFHGNGAQRVSGPKLESFQADYYEIAVDTSVLKLVERADIHVPILIALVQGEKVWQVRYLLWEDQVPFKADLFAKPADVTMEEIK
jgi:hypothetical protein